jgi:hypothetical protein
MLAHRTQKTVVDLAILGTFITGAFVIGKRAIAFLKRKMA